MFKTKDGNFIAVPAEDADVVYLDIAGHHSALSLQEIADFGKWVHDIFEKRNRNEKGTTGSHLCRISGILPC